MSSAGATPEDGPVDYGLGVGLDVADTFYFVGDGAGGGLSAVDKQHPYQNEIEYYDWSDPAMTPPAEDLANARDPITGRLAYKGWYEGIRRYIRCGWIDSVHGGAQNVVREPQWNGPIDGQYYYDYLTEAGLKINTFISHNSGNPWWSDIGNENYVYCGDDPNSDYYWANHLRAAGGRFLWGSGKVEQNLHTWGTAHIETYLTERTMRDGSKWWCFTRSNTVGAALNCLGQDFLATNLDKLVTNNTVEVVYTHFGKHYDWNAKVFLPNFVQPRLDQGTLDGFRRLRLYQDQGKILVARSSRQFPYTIAYLYAKTSETTVDDITIINIESIEDQTIGSYIPTLDDVRGLTWYCEDNQKVRVLLNGVLIDESDILRAPEDETMQQSVGIRWFDYDRTDYTTQLFPNNTGRIQEEGSPIGTSTIFSLSLAEAQPTDLRFYSDPIIVGKGISTL
jgi:hypothetical protein